jgi:hypothetical protein
MNEFLNEDNDENLQETERYDPLTHRNTLIPGEENFRETLTRDTHINKINLNKVQ